jgi:hypothetical protein
VVLLGALRLFSSLAVAAIMLFAIVAPLASVIYARGVDGRVYVVVPRSFVEWFERQGYSLGSLVIAMGSPSDYESYGFWLRKVDGERLLLDFRRVAESWAKHYSEKGKGEGSLGLPTLSITVTFNRGVEECVAHYTYSTVEYFVEIGFDVAQATIKAIEDPLAHLRKPLTVTLRPAMPNGEFKVVCTDTTPHLEELKRITDSLLTTESSTRDIASIGETQSCPPWFTEVWWTTLYDNRNNPPQGWMTNIYSVYGQPIPDNWKMYVWEFYATRYSQAYYYRADTYSLEWAKEITLDWLKLPSEGLYTMDRWIIRMFDLMYDRKDVQWKDYWENYGEFPSWQGYPAYIGFEVYNPNFKQIQALASIGGIAGRQERLGFAVLGLIIYSDSRVIRTAFTEPIGSNPNYSYHKGYVIVSTSYAYMYDGLLVHLDVNRVIVGSCGEYWRVVPYTAIMPIYYVAVDWHDRQRVYSTDPNFYPDFYRDLLYQASRDTICSRYISREEADKVLCSDRSSEHIAGGNVLASLAANVLSKAVETVMLNLICGSNPACSFFVIMITLGVNFIYEDIEWTAIAFSFYLETKSFIQDSFIRVDKMTLWATNAYNSIGWRPLMIEYKVYIDYNPPPPRPR